MPFERAFLTTSATSLSLGGVTSKGVVGEAGCGTETQGDDCFFCQLIASLCTPQAHLYSLLTHFSSLQASPLQTSFRVFFFRNLERWLSFILLCFLMHSALLIDDICFLIWFHWALRASFSCSTAFFTPFAVLFVLLPGFPFLFCSWLWASLPKHRPEVQERKSRHVLWNCI